MSNPCGGCGKAVYAAEQVRAVGKSWHKACLKCATCRKTVSNGNWNDTGGQIYCNHCYEKQFVDEETKKIVEDMENAYSKKVHGTAKALPGLGSSSGRPPIPTTVRTTTSVPSVESAYPSVAQPRKALSSALQNDIINMGGSVGGARPSPSRPTTAFRGNSSDGLKRPPPPLGRTAPTYTSSSAYSESSQPPRVPPPVRRF